MVPDKTAENETRQAIAKLANVHLLDDDYYLSLIDAYATHYGLDPNLQVWHMGFMDIFVFLKKWKKESEYWERYRKAEKMLTPPS